MTKRQSLITGTCNQMMKSGKGGRLNVDERLRERFREEHKRSIEWAIDHLPRGSYAVIAVVVKCILKHSKEAILPFCDKMKKGLFDGKTDPVLLLWCWLLRNKGSQPADVYKRSVTAVRACMEGRTISEIRPSKTDIFDWDEDYQAPFKSDEATQETSSPWADLEEQGERTPTSGCIEDPLKQCDDVYGYDLYRARHECGHGMIICGFGGSLVSVDIAERGDKMGRARYFLNNVGWPCYLRAKDKWFRAMFVSLAGEAATLRLPGYLGDEFEWSEDRATAEQCAWLLLRHCRRVDYAPDHREVSEYVRSQLKRVTAVLEKEHVVASLDVVAKELVEKRELSGKEFQHTARSALAHLQQWLPRLKVELPR